LKPAAIADSILYAANYQKPHQAAADGRKTLADGRRALAVDRRTLAVGRKTFVAAQQREIPGAFHRTVELKASGREVVEVLEEPIPS
jgi:hypothetical protein